MPEVLPTWNSVILSWPCTLLEENHKLVNYLIVKTSFSSRLDLEIQQT